MYSIDSDHGECHRSSIFSAQKVEWESRKEFGTRGGKVGNAKSYIRAKIR
jgi:hypothetical protein